MCIRDSATGEPVIGASVVEGRTTNGTITDVDGNFSLSVPANSTLNISFVGYKTPVSYTHLDVYKRQQYGLNR